MSYADVVSHRRAASKWSRAVADAGMSADPSARRFDSARPELGAAEARAAGSGSDASRSTLPLSPISRYCAPPRARWRSRGAGGRPRRRRAERGDRREAAVRRAEIAADALFASHSTRQCTWTGRMLGQGRVAALGRGARNDRDLQRVLPRQKAHRQRNAAPRLGAPALGNPARLGRCRAGVMDTVRAGRLAHRGIRSPESADATSKAPTFTGASRRRETSPMHAFRRMLRDPHWSTDEAGRAGRRWTCRSGVGRSPRSRPLAAHAGRQGACAAHAGIGSGRAWRPCAPWRPGARAACRHWPLGRPLRPEQAGPSTAPPLPSVGRNRPGPRPDLPVSPAAARLRRLQDAIH